MKPLLNHIILLIAVLILNPGLSFSQNPGQTVRGTLSDRITGASLPGAVLVIDAVSPSIGTATDANGQFKLEQVPYGRYSIKVSLMGYSPWELKDIVVSAGKEVVLELFLEESVAELKEATVTGSRKSETLNSMATLSARSFTMEEVERFAGGRADPSRLAANFAGVSAPNDARNDIVVRGNSPQGLLWRIEGLNVPNPNHFNTLGTTGGPVSALNTNTLRNSDFFTSAFPAEYGNAIAGVFDLGFRTGNTEKREHTVQLGALTGLEAMTEGPIKKGSGASYMAAYRYSFTGLAQQIGIPIGTAATPYYQDISFKINSAEGRAGRFTFFGIGGLSKIDFLHDEIDEEDIFAEPDRDNYVNSKIGATGLKHFIRLNDKMFLNSMIGASYTGNTFDSDLINQSGSGRRITELSSEQAQYIANSTLNYAIGSNMVLKAGLQNEIWAVNLDYRDREFTNDWLQIWKTNQQTNLSSAFMQFRYTADQHWTFNMGVRSQLLSLNTTTSLEPRVGIRYALNEKHSFAAGYGFHRQMQPLSVYFYLYPNPDGSYDETNLDLGFTGSHQWVISYDWTPAKEWRVKSELYYQKIIDVPVERDSSSFSMLNEGADFNPTERGLLVNEGQGINLGIELTVERFFSKGYYLLATGSVYDSEYQGSDGVWRNTAFNGRFVYNLLAGKEWAIGAQKLDRFNLDVKLTHSGGRYYTPVDLVASQQAGSEVLQGDAFAFTNQYPDFMRLDIKLGYTRNSRKGGLSHSVFFDIQNVTNRENVFAQRYNRITNTVNTAYQIGFFPNFIYRIQF
jgi:hypothetical protein